MHRTAVAVSVAVFLCLLGGVIGHATLYPEVDKITCQQKNPPPQFHSYHIHVLFFGTSKNQTLAAMALRDEFIETFQPNGTCPSLYHQDFLCMFEVNLVPWGPFIQAEWAAFIPIELFAKAVPWIMQRRLNPGLITVDGPDGMPGESIPRYDFTVLVHGNSGCEISDHSTSALWGGQPSPINFEAMDTEDPFDNTPDYMSTHNFNRREKIKPKKISRNSVRK